MIAFQQKKVLVTGASGFLGSHLAEALLREGAHVRALVRGSGAHGAGSSLERVAGGRDVEVAPGDLRDLAAVRRAARDVDQVFHVGGLGCVPSSLEDPLTYVDVNVRGSAHVLQAAREAGVGGVLLMSSSEVYGGARYNPVDEAHPVQPRSPYAASKLATEQLGASYHTSFGLPVTIVRGFNVYGPRQPERNLVPTLVRQALEGDEVRTGRLDSVRDYIYVTDAIDALLLLATTPAAVGRTFNVGSGLGSTADDLIAFIAKIMKKELRVHSDPALIRPRGIQARCLIADPDAVCRVTGWRPKVALDQGLGEVVRWYQERRERGGAREFGPA